MAKGLVIRREILPQFEGIGRRTEGRGSGSDLRANQELAFAGIDR